MSDQLRTRLGAAAILFAILAIWILQHPYEGFEYNDASLYSFFALARLHPLSVGTDLFVRFGSQDSFTVFTPIYAAAVRAWGLEPAATVLSLIGQMLFFAAAWRLARTLMPNRTALLAVGLLVALPSDYGAQQVFRYVESFITPRQFAEAAVLAALAANLAGRHVIAGVCLFIAAVLHPIMAASGIVLLTCLHVVIPRPRAAAIAAAGMALVALVPVLVIPIEPFAPFDSEWLGVFDSAVSYLFVKAWSAEDWAHLSVPLALLAMGALTTGVARVRNLCLAALLTAACGLAVTWVYVDILHSVLFTRLQAWRWLWLVQSLAVLLLPDIVRSCWNRRSGTSALLVLATAWVLSHSTKDPFVSTDCVALSCIAIAILYKVEKSQWLRLLRLGGILLLSSALFYNVIFKLQYVPLNPVTAADSRLLDPKMVEVWGGDGIFYGLALVTVWRLAASAATRVSSILLCGAIATSLGLLTSSAWRSWTYYPFPPAMHEEFADWRARIPIAGEGVFPRTPFGNWYVLERPTFYAPHQAAGDIFSRAKAMEVHRRAEIVAAIGQAQVDGRAAPGPALPHMQSSSKLVTPMPDLNERGLVLLCETSSLDFYVSQRRLNLPSSGKTIVPNPNKPLNQFRLYRCADIGKSQSTSRSPPPLH